MSKTITVNLAVTADTQRAKAQLSELQNSLQKLTANSANLHVGLDAAELQKASAAVNDLAIHLREATNVRTGTLDFSKLSQSIKASGSTLQEYGNQLLRLGPQGQQAFNQLAQSVAKSEVPIRRMSGLLGDFGKTLANTVKWQISSSMIHGIMGSIQHAVGYAQDLNESLNKIQIVTQQSDAQMTKFAANANKAAQALSTTTTTYTDAALIYYQQGLSAKEVEERTNVTIKMANAAGVSAKTVSDQMTAVWNNFADGSKSLEYYADVMTALGAATASSTDEISAGLEKFAAVADTVGLSYENAAAALATITATTRQSADSVGTGLRTLFSRLQSVSLGQTLEDGVNLTKYSSALEKIGVSVLDTTGQLRSMDDILEDMGARWNQLNDSQKTALAQTVGGVRQYTTLIALMDNFDFYKQNQQVALGSEGTVQKQADTYAKGWEASQKRVKASAEAIYSDLINDKFFITLNNGFATVLKGVDGLIDGLGGLKTILPAIAALMLQAFGPQITTGMVNFASQLQLAFTNPNKLQNERDSFLETAARQQVGIFNQNQPLDEEQKYRLDLAKKELELQQIYGRNQSVMSDHEKTAAKIGLDTYSSLRQQYEAQYSKLPGLRQQATDIRTGLVNQANTGIAADLVRMSTNKNNHKALGTGTGYDKQEAQALWNRFYKTQSEAQRAEYGFSTDKTTDKIKFDSNTFIKNLGKDFEDSFVGPIKSLEELKRETSDWNGSLDKLKQTLESHGASKQEIDTAFGTVTEEDKEGQRQALQTFIDQKTEQIYQNNVSDFAQKWGFTTDQVQKYAEAIRAAAGDEEKLKAIAEQIKQTTETTTTAVKKRNQGMINAQNIVSTAQAMMSLSSAASSATTFTNGLIDVFQGKGTASIGTFTAGIANLGSTVMMAVSGFNALSKAIPALAGGPWGIILTIASVAIPTIISLIDRFHENSDEKLQRLGEEANEAKEAANQSAQAYQNLLSTRSSHNDLLDRLNDLTAGTLEFRDALIQANNLADEIIANNNLKYGTDWFINEKGAKIITNDAYQRIGERDLKKAEFDANISAISATKETEAVNWDQYQKKQQTYYNSELTDENKTINGIISKEDQIRLNGDNNFQGRFTDNLRLDTLVSLYADWLSQTEDAVTDFDTFFKKIIESEDKDLNDFEQSIQGDLMNYEGYYNNEKIQQYLQDYYETNLTDLGQSVYQERINSGILSPYESNFISKNEDLIGILTSAASKGGEPDILDDFIINQLSKQYAVQGTTVSGLSETALNEIKETIKNREKGTTEEEALIELFKQETGLDLTDRDYFSNYYDSANKKLKIADVEQALADYQAYQSIITNFDEERSKVATATLKSYTSISKMNGKQIAKMLAELKANQSLGDYYDEFSQWVIDQEQSVYTAYNTAQAKYMDMEQIKSTPINNDIKLSDYAAITDATNMYGEAFGDKVGAAVNKALTQSAIDNDGLINALRDVDFEETALGTMKNIAQVSRGLAGTGGADILQSFRDGEEGNFGLFKELYNSETFADSLKALQKAYKKTGKIGADAIISVAENSEELALLLEDDEINAVALADALELIEIPGNSINSMDDLSNAMLKALTAAGDLENHLAGVYSYIDNFQQDRSVTDIGKFYQGLGKNAIESFENGFLVDDNLLQTFGEFFDDEFVSDYYDYMAMLTGDQNLSPEQISQQAYEQFKAQFDAIKKVVKDGDLSGMWDFYASTDEEIGKLGKLNEHNQFELNNIDTVKTLLGENFTASDFINYLEGEGVPDHLAEAMVTEYSRTNVALGQHFRQQGAVSGLGTLFSEDTINLNQLTAYVNKYKDVLKGMSLEDFSEIVGLDTDVLSGLDINMEKFGDGVLDVTTLLGLLADAADHAGKKIINLGDGFKANQADIEGLKEAYESHGNGDFTDYIFGKKDKGNRRTDINYDEIDDNGDSIATADLSTIQNRLAKAGVTSTTKQFEDMQQMLDEGLDGVNLDGFTTQIQTASGAMKTLSMNSSEFEKWCTDNNLDGTVEDFSNFAEELQNNEDLTKAVEQQASVMSQALIKAFSGGENGKPLEMDITLKLANDTQATITGEINNLKLKLFGQDGKGQEWEVTTTLAMTDDDDVKGTVKEILENVSSLQTKLQEHNGININITKTGNGSLLTGTIIGSIAAALKQVPKDATDINIGIESPTAEEMNNKADAMKNIGDAVDKLKDKTIYINVNYTKPGKDGEDPIVVGEGFQAIIEVTTNGSEATAQSAIDSVVNGENGNGYKTEVTITANNGLAAGVLATYINKKQGDTKIGVNIPPKEREAFLGEVKGLKVEEEKPIKPKLGDLDPTDSEKLANITKEETKTIKLNCEGWPPPGWEKIFGKETETEETETEEPETEEPETGGTETRGESKHFDPNATYTGRSGGTYNGRTVQDTTLSDETEHASSENGGSFGSGILGGSMASYIANAPGGEEFIENRNEQPNWLSQLFQKSFWGDQGNPANGYGKVEQPTEEPEEESGDTKYQEKSGGYHGAKQKNKSEILDNDKFDNTTTTNTQVTEGEPIEVPATITEFNTENVEPPSTEVEIEEFNTPPDVEPPKPAETSETSETSTNLTSDLEEAINLANDLGQALDSATQAIEDVSLSDLESQISTIITILGNMTLEKFLYEAGAAGSQLLTAKQAANDLATAIQQINNGAETLDMQPALKGLVEGLGPIATFFNDFKTTINEAGEQIKSQDIKITTTYDDKATDKKPAVTSNDPIKVKITTTYEDDATDKKPAVTSNDPINVTVTTTYDDDVIDKKPAVTSDDPINVTITTTYEQVAGAKRPVTTESKSPTVTITSVYDEVDPDKKPVGLDVSEHTIVIKTVYESEGEQPPLASGFNNGNGRFARGKHSGNDYWGIAEVGELGPELMIHRGMPYLAGVGGRTKAYIEPGDTIFTAAETQKILAENPTLQDIPGFSVGYGRFNFGNSGGGGYGSGAKEKNRKTKDFEPERYHLITRQLADITRRYDRLDKIKDKAFGKNKVDAIQAEIDVTNDLIKAQDQLIKEASDYQEKDIQRLKDLGIDFVLDEHGNLENFEELQEKYGRAAAEEEDEDAKKAAEERWKAIKQYEETIDKLNEANEQMDDYIFQLQELQLEKITTAVEMKIDYDDKNLDLLQHYLDKIEDDIYATADAFQIVGAQIDTTIHQINSAYNGIEGILKELHDQNGKQIGPKTIAEFLALSPEERNDLLANSEDMEKIVDYVEQIIKFDEDLEEKKLFGVEQLAKGFEQLNGNLEDTIDLYEHYDNLYNSIRDISDLQGAEISKHSQALLKTLNQNILNNNLNNVRAQQQYYQSLQANRKALENMLANETDDMIAKEIRKQIDDIDSSLRDAQEELLSLWQEGLQMARDEFERAIEEAVNVYNMALSGMYQTIKRLEDTYSRKKEIQDEYLEDYEKYYQLSKLERDINGTIDDLAASGMKNNKGLARVLKEVNDAQKSGAELSQYDLDVLVKKYELEKARAELEEARDAKSIVRLQRDRSGNWGYVYTQDEDNIAELEQRYEEALYQYQKLNDSHLEELLDSVMKFQEEMGDQVQDIMTDTELTQEEKIKLIEDLNIDYLAKQEFLFSEINKSMENQGTTYGRAIDLYKGKTSELGDAFIDLNDTWEETLLSQILGIKDLDAYKDTMTKAWNDLLHSTGEALVEYQDTLEKVNEKTGTSTEDFMNDAGSWIEAIGNSSDKTTEKVKVLGQEMITQFDKMAEEAMKWEEKIVPAIQAIVDQTEAFANEMTNAIGLMNEAIDLSDAYLVALHSSRKEVGIEAPYIIDALQDKIVENPEIADIMPMVISTLDTTMRSGGFGLGNLIPATVSDISGGFQQQVEIHAEFPNATDHYEIEEAFNNLVNKATQYANTKTTGMEY